jgi:DNA primase
MATYRSNAAEYIKQSLSMWEVAERYDFLPNRSGNILCPFHSERTPSLKIYKEPGRGFCCYGCGAAGSIIDFVMRLFSIDFRAACVRINYDFGLGLSLDGRPDPHAAAKLARDRREKKRERERLATQIKALCAEHRRLWFIIQAKAPKNDSEVPDPEWVKALCRVEYVAYQIEELQKQEARR